MSLFQWLRKHNVEHDVANAVQAMVHSRLRRLVHGGPVIVGTTGQYCEEIRKELDQILDEIIVKELDLKKQHELENVKFCW